MARLEVMNPVASRVETEVPPAQRLDSLAGKTIGLFWNSKSGGDVALARVAELLSQRFPDVRAKQYAGGVGGMAFRILTPEETDTIARQCQAVISTTAD